MYSYDFFQYSYYQQDYQQEEPSYQNESDTFENEKICVTKQSKKIKKSNNPTEAKNIPKNLGGLLKNHLSQYHNDKAKTNLAIKKFLSKANEKKNYTRLDLMKLFEDEIAKELCSNYLTSFQIIEDILKSEKIQDAQVHLKYIKKLYIGTINPNSLSNLKYSD